MIRRHALVVAFTAIMMTAIVLPARAEEGTPETEATPADLTTEQRLQRIEEEIRDMRDQRQKLRSELGLDAKTKGAFVLAAGKENTLRLGGLVQFQGDAGDKGDSRFGSDNSRFYLRRARINAGGDFLEGFDFRVEAELYGSLSETTAMRAQMTDGYVTWKKYGFASVRAGQFKTPYGHEQLASDPKLSTIERSLANDRLTLGRQVGLQLSGDVAEKRFSYAGGAFNGNGVNSSSNDNSKFTWVGRLSAVPWHGTIASQKSKFSLGANSFVSDDNLSGQPSEFAFSTSTTGKVDNVFVGQKIGWGVDAQYNLGRLDLWAEYLQTQFEPENDKPSSRVIADGWYVQAAYFIMPDKLQGVLKYDSYKPDNDKSDNTTATWTAGLNYLIKGDDLKLQLDYLRSDVPGQDDAQDKLIARVQVIF